MENDKKKFILAGGCLLVVLFFLFTVLIRLPLFARPLDTHHEWLTAHSICVTRNWLQEGAFKLKFLQILNPASIEFDSISSREPYASYPPGALIPVFLLAKLFNATDLVSLFQTYNLVNHLAIALLLFLIMARIALHLNRFTAFTAFFSLMPAMVYLFTPPTLYWHQNVYYSDQAVMLLFAIFIFLEIGYFLKGKPGWPGKVALAAIVFIGTLTDWLFVFVIASALTLRVLSRIGQNGKPGLSRLFRPTDLILIIPSALAIAIFLLQIIPEGLLKDVLARSASRLRAGSDGVVTSFWEQHFRKFVIEGYGPFLFFFSLWGSGALLLRNAWSAVKRNTDKNENIAVNAYMYLACLSALPCILQIFTFQQHSIVHDFSALKWALPMSLIPFGIIPILAAGDAKKGKGSRKFELIILSLFIALAGWSVFYRTAVKRRLFAGEGRDSAKVLGEFVGRNSDFHDICFAFEFEIPVYPPQFLAYSGKRVYKIENLDQARDFLSPYVARGAKGKVFISEQKWKDSGEEMRDSFSNIRRDGRTGIYICEMKPLDGVEGG